MKRLDTPVVCDICNKRKGNGYNHDRCAAKRKLLGTHTGAGVITPRKPEKRERIDEFVNHLRTGDYGL
jgi:hypothetical protein